MAFEEEGFCIVRGPDLLWGGRIERFHPPAGRFDGVIGGPPCQAFSVMQGAIPQRPTENLIPEYERCVSDAAPKWFIMENVMGAPLPAVDGYTVQSVRLNNRWLGEEQNRLRRFSFGGLDLRPHLQLAALDNPVWEYAVVGGNGGPDHGRKTWGQGSQAVPHMLRLQGLRGDFFTGSPFTVHAQRRMLGNGVPLPMGRAIAKAVKKALGV
jgi:DNA (cytosine-5)-methyltransferase 1